MKIALINLCDNSNFSLTKYHEEAIKFLNDEDIKYIDLTNTNDLAQRVSNFEQAILSDVDLIRAVRGGVECINILDRIDRDLVVKSNKKFYGLSDFTHFSTLAVSKNIICYYGQGLGKINQLYPNIEDHHFIVSFLKTGEIKDTYAEPLYLDKMPICINNKKIIGGHILVFSFMQNKIQASLHDRYIFIEYHSNSSGEALNLLGYYIDQLKYSIGDKAPKGFILGKNELLNSEGIKLESEIVNQFIVDKLLLYNVPIYYIDHFHNIITFS